MRALTLLCVISSCTLAACAIPYQTPEAKAQIEQELGVNASDLISMSETGLCVLNYGDEAVCHAQQGLSVLTRKGLILASYDFGHYRPILTLQPGDVLCAQTMTARNAAEPVNVFTQRYAAVLLPVTPQGKWNAPMHTQVIDYLLASGQPLLIGRAGMSSRPSDKDKTVVGTVPGTRIPYVATSGYMEEFNPCPA